MKFKYKGIEGRFIDFKVVETGFCFTWIRLQYELYENGEVYSQDWTELISEKQKPRKEPTKTIMPLAE